VCVNTKELTHEPVITESIFKPIQNAVNAVTDAVDGVVTDAFDKIVMKNAGIVGKLKTAKQNLIGRDGETTDSQFKPVSVPIH